MFSRNKLQLVALISCTVALSGCFGSEESTTGASDGGAAGMLDTTAPVITIAGE